MKAISLLPLALVASALVIPDIETQQSLQKQLEQKEPSHPFWDNIKNPETIWEEIEERFNGVAGCAKHRFDDTIQSVSDTVVKYGEKFEDAFAGDAWLDTADEDLDLTEGPPPHGPPGHGPPGRGPPGHGPPGHEKPPHKGPPGHGPPGHGPPGHEKPPHKGPHHGRPHHGPANLTVYQLIAGSKYTTKLAKAINEFPDLVDLLNGTKANYTVFAPTDRAFEKIPEGAPKPSKEFLKKLLTYHVSPSFYPAGRILASRTVPTALEAEAIGKVPQRISTQIGLRGLTLNFYSRVIAINIFGTNGVIHGIDSILLPPPKVVDIINALPGEFSTLELGLVKTGLFPLFNDTSLHSGGTLFAPSNLAFLKLGPRINAFLFSKYGEKYLKALLLYHAVDNITLYSDAVYKIEADEVHGHPGVPKGFFHIDLPTGLEGKSLSIDVARYGRLITIKINGFTTVSVLDGVAADGVIHVVPNVLIPPKVPGGSTIAAEDMTLEEFMDRLAPFVQDDEEGLISSLDAGLEEQSSFELEL